MKYLALVLTLFMTACASNIKTSAGTNGSNTSLRVIGTGSTVESAKNNGFASAIEIAVGSVVLTDTEVQGNTLIRDEIIKHSAGYVDDFKIINQTYINGQHTLVMDVDVKSSRIHERLLNRSPSSIVEGPKLANQYNTYINERGTGDRVLQKLLNEFPNNAMTVTQGKTEFKLDGQRNGILVVPFELRWNYRYITALNEALTVLQDKPELQYFNTQCMCYKSPERIVTMAKDPNAWLIGERKIFHFNDSVRARNVREALSQPIMLHVKVSSLEGKTLYSQCYNTNQTFRGTHDQNTFVVFGNDVEKNTVQINVNEDLKSLKNAEKVELTVRGQSC